MALSDREGLILSNILAELFYYVSVYFEIKTIYEWGIFTICCAFSYNMREAELAFLFVETEFWIIFSFSILSAWPLSGYLYCLHDDLLISKLLLEFEIMFSFSMVELIFFECFLTLARKYEFKSCAFGWFNTIFFLTSSTAIAFMKSLSVCDHSF